MRAVPMGGDAMRRWARVVAVGAALVVLASCSSSADDDASSDPSSTTATSAVASDGSSGEAAKPTGSVDDCPTAFKDKDLDGGTYEDFESAGQKRSFHLLVPDEDAPG